VTAIDAAVCRSFGRPLSLETVELREPGPGEVQVQVAACAICHTDLTLITGAWGGELPAVYGHEVAGVVEAVGPAVVGVSDGDHVVVTLVRSCGRCARCLGGEPALCMSRGEFALSRETPLRDGEGAPVGQALRTAGFAERVLVHESQVVPIPRDAPLESASLIGCGVVTGIGAVLNNARLQAGSTLGVIGTGGVGLNSIQGGVLAGARTIIGLDLEEEKLRAALEFGATDILDAGREDLASAIGELTDGHGLDAIVVTAGSAAAVEQALTLVATAGAVVLVGMPAGAAATIDPETIAERGLRILGSKVGAVRPHVDIPALVALYRQGRLKLDELISARFSLSEINHAIALAEGGATRRVVVVP
jgi:S-(hydroxymethyl)glutathione dehydrogenase / alcohol dehydrogenase